jgi:hypothetical protein
VSSTNLYHFHCTGAFDVDSSLKVERDYMHSPVKFHLPDGRVVDLFVGLRVINTDGTEEYLHKTKDLEALGFIDQAYESLEFIPFDSENEDVEPEWVRGSVKQFLSLSDEEMDEIEQRIKEDKEKGAN